MTCPVKYGWIVPGLLVRYESAPGYVYLGVVDEHPRLLGEGAWVVRLRDMDARYRRMRGRDHAVAASCDVLSPATGI